MSRPPKAQWRAPGRVNLIGDHTDYCEGFVLPMALDRECVIAVTPGADDRVKARSLQLDGVVDVAADGHDEPRTIEPSWGRFVAGAVQAVTERGARVPALDLEVSSTVPTGSGLSSSSALAVALTLALADAGDLELDRRDAARVALDAEVRATGVPGGLMDQLASLFGEAGHALLIDCRSLDIEAIPIPDDIAVLVADSGLPRTLADSEYAQRRAACEQAAAALGMATLRDATIDQVRNDPRARHVVTENARVLACADALRANDINTIGALMLASHASLRDDFAVSTPELDLLVDLLVDAGAVGARLTGAGFGGCVVGVAPLADTDADAVLARVSARYRTATGLVANAFVGRAGTAAGHTLLR